MNLSHKLKSIACLVVAALVSPALALSPLVYGQPVKFAKGRELLFADFTLRFVGVRKVSSPIFKPGFTFWDFEVKSGTSVQTVSWTSGTGVIDSASFTVHGRPYELELKGSVAREGWLRDDELVVWPQADFLKALEARRQREQKKR